MLLRAGAPLMLMLRYAPLRRLLLRLLRRHYSAVTPLLYCGRRYACLSMLDAALLWRRARYIIDAAVLMLRRLCYEKYGIQRRA